MIRLSFFLKFKSQLRRTRPDIVRVLDESVNKAIIDAGGRITGNRDVISALFDEEKTGFWLDVYILIENLKKEIETNKELFGYSLVISPELHNSQEKLCCFLANHGGVFIYEKLAENFIPYAVFEKPSQWLKEIKPRKYNSGSFYRIRELKNFKSSGRNDSELQNEIIKILKREENKNVLILGQPHLRIRSGIYSYCNKINEDFPPLTICFRSAGTGSLVDIWSAAVRSLFEDGDTPEKTMEEIDSLWELLFRERLRDEVSDYAVRCLTRFLFLIFDSYADTALDRNRTPVLVLENIHLAGTALVEILCKALSDIKERNRSRMIIFGTGEDGVQTGNICKWENVFDKVKKIEIKNQKQILYPRLSNELWEIVYAVALFSTFFPPELFQTLFEESGLNPAMITRAVSVLHGLGIIDNLREPRIVNGSFEEKARNVLGGKTEKIKKLVCAQLLRVAERQTVSPCFRMLVAISDLQGPTKIDGVLLLKSILSDIINGTTTGIENALKNEQSVKITAIKAPAVRFVFNTSKALHLGTAKDIENAVNAMTNDEIKDEYGSLPVLKTQILINAGACCLGKHNVKEAAVKTKEAIFLGQGKNAFCLPQAYRMYALVCLSKQEIKETIEYLRFAVSNAEKAGSLGEASVSAYYLAAAYFLYGDLYNCEKSASVSIKHSLGSGRVEWADRSRFIRGRVEFELGRYKEASDIFNALRSSPDGKHLEQKDSLLAAWIYRCEIYTGKPDAAKSAGDGGDICGDADLFEIEAACLSQDYKKVIELCKSYKNPFSSGSFLFTEQAEWNSGFAQCEHLFFSCGETEDRLKRAFHSLALSGVREGEGAMVEIQQILRDEKLCEIDPWDAFYYYAKYRVLKNSGDDLVEMSTAVSMAFKRLQRRAARIEDIETRRQYLNGGRWNKELYLTAKEFKFI